MEKTIHPYRKFKPDLNDIGNLFSQYVGTPGAKFKTFGLDFGYGKDKVDALGYYLQDFGLLDKQYAVTELGALVFKHDKYFEDDFTRFLLLYQWQLIDRNPACYYLLNMFDFSGQGNYVADFTLWARSQDIKTDYKEDFVGILLRNTLGSLTDENAFKNLKIIRKLDNELIRTVPIKLPVQLVCYIFFMNQKGRTSITFDQLLIEPGNIGKFFHFDRGELQSQIYALRDLNLVQYVQAVNLHNIVFTSNVQPNDFIVKYYEQFN